MKCAALFVDFDNVFSALAALDEGAAYDFATDPGRWLRWFGGSERERRYLIRRCYMNPGGAYTPQPGGWLAEWHDQPRLYFSRFRSAFVHAGFQVVDCPTLARTKNGADIQIALDVVDALAAPVPIREFVILSSDSDFTPLLHRLRLHDRWTTIVVQAAAAPALVAAADAVLDLRDFAAQALPPQPLDTQMEPERQAQELLALLRRCLADSEGPLPLAHLGQRLNAASHGWAKTTNYAGYGSLARFLAAARPEDIVLTQGPGGGWIHDRERHTPPRPAEAAGPAEGLPPG